MVSPTFRLGNDANRSEGTNREQIIPINGNNVESDGEDTIFGQGGNDLILGLGENDTIGGGSGDDDIRGNDGEDVLFGDNDNDQLRGGDDNDKIYGGTGNDLIFGQGGADTLVGAQGNDTLTGLGELNRRLVDDVERIITNERQRFEEMWGDGASVPIAARGADVFNLRNASDDEGQLFVRGQIYALIRDFRTADGDKIRLPGSPDNYVAELAGPNNNDTAIYYVEEQDIDVGFGVGVVSFGTGLSIDVPERSALVAIVEDAVVRNMFDENFYEYTGV